MPLQTVKPIPAARSIPPSNKPTGARKAAIVAAIVASLALWESSNKHIGTPYYDVAGILTVCDGITGKDVVKGKYYTREECKQLTAEYVNAMVYRMSACVTADLPDGMWVWLGHFTYNIGNKGFCNSSIVKKANAGDFVGACKGMAAWTWTTIKGKKVNCRKAGKVCSGLVTRRDFEVSSCLNAL